MVVRPASVCPLMMVMMIMRWRTLSPPPAKLVSLVKVRALVHQIYKIVFAMLSKQATIVAETQILTFLLINIDIILAILAIFALLIYLLNALDSGRHIDLDVDL